MNEVKQKDSETWEALEKGDSAVARTGISLTDLFVDQALEQKIRQLIAVGGITCSVVTVRRLRRKRIHDCVPVCQYSTFQF